MKCPKCQTPAAADALFCAACGAELPERVVETPSLGEMPTVRGLLPARSFKPGDKLMGRYRVLDELGRGGMGVVYKCLDEVGRIEVALKALPPEVSHNSSEMDEVRDNFQLISKLVHQHIAAVKTLECDPVTGDYFLILELVEGVDLRKWRRQQDGKVALEHALPVLQQIAQALDYAHSRKIIHRDVKPANVMVSPEGFVKILDFGLAAQIQSSLARVSQVHFSTSGTGPYMAPEQWRGQMQDGATDQYALAVLAYELIGGRAPFEVQDQVVLRECVLRDPPEKLANLAPESWRVLARGLSKNRAERFASCGEFIRALAGEPEPARPKTEKRREISEPGAARAGQGKSKAPLVVAAAAAAVLLAAGIWYWGLHLPAARQQAEQARVEAAASAARAVSDQLQQEAAAERLRKTEENAAAAKARAEADAAQKRQQAAAAPKEAPRPALARGGLEVATDPAGATVSLEGEAPQTSPANFKNISIGKKVLTVGTTGYEPVTQEVEITENKSTDLGTLKLVRQTGSVKITSDPSGATVLQGGQAVGTTPLELPAVPTGEVTYRLRLERHLDATVAGRVEPKQSTTLAAALAKVPYPDLRGIWTNSLGQVLAPVPGTEVLFGVWDVRVQDFAEYVSATGYVASNGMYSLRSDGWKQRGDTWQNPGFSQGPTHPVVGVSWTEAKAYCDWLTQRERAAGLIAESQGYRLPTDVEWSVAVGLKESSEGTPNNKDRETPDVYPWGSQWPPPEGAGNYAGNEAADENWPDSWKTVAGYRDGFARTSPVGSFRANQFGLYDMGGNVWQWCEDWCDNKQNQRTLRGASWGVMDRIDMLSSCRFSSPPNNRNAGYGFRCVLARILER